MVNPDRARSRTFVVTGAASGIGLATARRLLAEGGTVVGADLAAPPDDLGPRFTFVPADVTDEAAIAAVLDACRAASTASSTPPVSPGEARCTCSTAPNGTA